MLRFISLIFLIKLSSCLLDQDCENWKQFCGHARNSSDNYFQCYVPKDHGKRSESVILYLERTKKTWNEARESCSSKFGGTPLADLVQLTDTKKAFAEQLLREIGDHGVKDMVIATNGVCCIKKLERDRHTVGVECEWLSTGETFSDSLILDRVENRCKIYTAKFDGNNLKLASSLDNSAKIIMPYLCGFNLPHNCDVHEYAQDNSSVITTTKIIYSTESQTTTMHPERDDVGGLSVAILSANLKWIYNSYVIVYAINQSDPVQMPYHTKKNLICTTGVAFNTSQPIWRSNCPNTGQLWSVSARLVFELWDDFANVFLGGISFTISDLLTDELDNIPAKLPLLKGHDGQIEIVVSWKK